jgi:hypothetical protein
VIVPELFFIDATTYTLVLDISDPPWPPFTVSRSGTYTLAGNTITLGPGSTVPDGDITAGQGTLDGNTISMRIGYYTTNQLGITEGGETAFTFTKE